MSFIVAIFAFIKTSIVLVNNLLLGHIIGGKTLIEQKHKNRIKRKSDIYDPFNKGCVRNCWHTFGQLGLGWFLPLPSQFDDGNFRTMVKEWKLKKSIGKHGEKMPYLWGVSINNFSEDFFRHAHSKVSDDKDAVKTKLALSIKHSMEKMY